MLLLYSVSVLALTISLIVDPAKTKQSVKTTGIMFFNALPSFLGIILVMVVILYFISPETIVRILSKGNETTNIFIASLIGSIAIIPGFITFPIAGILKDIGVSYGVLAGLTTSLMMVGVITFPLEKKYFGTRFALYRNISSYTIAIIVSIVIGILLKEGV